MNWGKGIVIGLVVFVTFISAMGVYMFGQPDDYDKQYYEKGLAFNADYVREKQVYIDKLQPEIRISSANLLINFVKPAVGKIHFVRPSDRKMDQVLGLKTDQNDQVHIPLSQLAKGPWNLVIEWANGGRKYLYQQEIFVP